MEQSSGGTLPGLVVLNRLKGGLGNQLFQHVFGLGLARKLNAELVTDVGSFDTDPYGRKNYSWYLPQDGRYGALPEYLGSGCYLLEDGQIQSITDSINLPGDIRALVLSGYWQKESLLDKSAVAQTYGQLSDEASRLVSIDVVEHITELKNAVAIHIRRHDYGHHGLCRESYYYAAIEYLKSYFADAELFVFSDEPNYAQHLMTARGLQFTSVSSGSASGDLYLMSLCKHFVIANSSYSWWAAYFGESKGGLVICPKEWVMTGKLPSPCPPRWMQVENAVTSFQINQADIHKHLEYMRVNADSGGAVNAYSNLIDLPSFFDGMKDYVVIKLYEHFPNYFDYQDVDIVCGDIDAIYAHIIAVAQPYIKIGFRVEVHKDEGHFHVDVYAPGTSRLNFRFDLISSFSIYTKFSVDSTFHKVVLGSKQLVKINGATVYVPAPEYELAIRCLEYLEWHEKIPSKKKHLDYIMAKNDNKFLSIIEKYTNLVLPSNLSSNFSSKSDSPELNSSIAIAISSRYDYFMIWGHGLEHTSDILSIIRNNPKLEIISIVKREVQNVESFVQQIYACDTVPFHHLVEKTRYLLTTVPMVVFILVLNHDPQEMYFGEGAFRHIQSKRIKDVKEEIRNRFNPRYDDGRRTENHVIHASDYPSQVEHVLAVLKLPTLNHYQEVPHPGIDAPYHLGKIGPITVQNIDVHSLFASILGEGLVNIKDTPHYKYVTGNKSEYLTYHADNFGVALTDDHLPESFDQKIEKFDYGKEVTPGRRSLILVKRLYDGRYQILDGVHRASILANMKVNLIECAVVD